MESESLASVVELHCQNIKTTRCQEHELTKHMVNMQSYTKCLKVMVSTTNTLQRFVLIQCVILVPILLSFSAQHTVVQFVTKFFTHSECAYIILFKGYCFYNKNVAMNCSSSLFRFVFTCDIV